MSDEPEIKRKELSEDELNQVAGGTPAVTVTVKKPTPPPTWPPIDGPKGESTDSDHKDWIEL